MSIDAMKLALEALEDLGMKHYESTGEVLYKETFTALRQAIEQAQKQEPVSWESILGAVARGWCYEENANKTMDSELAVAIAKEVQALYTSPPQRQPLTNEEICPWFQENTALTNEAAMRITRAIEAAHGITGDKT